MFANILLNFVLTMNKMSWKGVECGKQDDRGARFESRMRIMIKNRVPKTKNLLR